MAHPWPAGIILWLGGFFCLWNLLLAIRPLALLAPLRFCASVSEFTFFGFKIPKLEHAILLSPFVYRERVLDHWVRRHIARARTSFAERDTVKERVSWVSLPVKAEGKIIPKLSPQDLRQYFRQAQLHLLIHGDGGAGKTALACEIGRWAMEAESARRLRTHFMIPVLLEFDFVQGADEKPENVATLVRQENKKISGSVKDLPEQFGNKLCSLGRILVIVDSLSERSAAVREFLARNGAAGPFQFVVLTSRTDERQVLRLFVGRELNQSGSVPDNNKMTSETEIKSVYPECGHT